MGKFVLKNINIDAFQWYKNGDHPDDDCEIFTSFSTGQKFLGEGKIVRYFRDPEISSNTLCADCNEIMHFHGFIDIGEGIKVCPGDWIITDSDGKISKCDPGTFQKLYKKV